MRQISSPLDIETLERFDNLGQFVKLLKEKKKHKRGKILVFAGAAVSTGQPALLPHANQLIAETLNLLFDDRVESLIQSAGLSHQGWRQTAGQYSADRLIPPEMIYDAVYEFAGRKVFSAFTSLGDGQPNTVHRILAALLARGYVDHIIITNFDCLIEAALTEEGYDSDRVWKIHGSLGDNAQLITTFRRVGKRLFDLSILRELESMLEDSHVLFIGYGGTDPDLLPALTQAHIRTIDWIEIKDLTDFNQPTLRKLCKATGEFRWIQGDLYTLMEAVAGELRLEDCISPGVIDNGAAKKARQDKLVHHMQSWESDPQRRLTESEKILAVLQLMYNIAPLLEDESFEHPPGLSWDAVWSDIYRLAEAYQQKLIAEDAPFGSIQCDLHNFQAEACLQRASILRQRSERQKLYQKAGPHLKAVLTRGDFNHVYVQTLLNSGVLSAGEENWQAAGKFLAGARQMVGGPQLAGYEYRLQLQARIEANLAVYYAFTGKKRRSRKAFDSAHQLFKECGDLRGYFECCLKAAEMYLAVGKRNKAIAYSEMAAGVLTGLPTVGGFPHDALETALDELKRRLFASP